MPPLFKSSASSFHPGQVDRKLALSFGALVLLLMLTVAGAAMYLFHQLQESEENRLSTALAAILSESISRISFSGKYHARLLVEEMQARVPELLYLSVESTSGVIVAHSDSSQNDARAGGPQMKSLQASLQTGNPVISKVNYGGRMVKEVVLPYHGGPDAAVEGIVRLGINVEGVRNGQQENRYILFLLIGILTLGAMVVVFLLSRHFGGAVRVLATQLQGILDHAPLSIGLSNQAGQLVLHSVEFERIFGHPKPGQASDSFLEQKLAAADLEKLRAIDAAVLETGASTEQEATVALGGQECHWLVSKFPIARDKKNGVTLICTFYRDITQYKKALEALRESEEAFRNLFENSSDAILLLKDGRFVECNRAALKYLGDMLRSDLIGKLPPDISPSHQPDGRTSAEAAMEHDALAMKNGYERFDWVCCRKDGSLIDLDVALTRIVIRGETMLHITWRDITERKHAEFERQKLQSQLLQAHKMESVGRLAGGVAHDFNNMLQAILGNAQLTLDQLTPTDPLRENLEEITASAQRAADLTRQLLAFARQQTVVPRVLDLNETVMGMLKMLRRLIGEDIHLSWSPGGGLWPVKIDPTQVDQVLANLCVNARDAIAGVGLVNISTENVALDAQFCQGQEGVMPGDHILLAVSDSGAGIPPDIMPHIFEPFYTTKGQGKGTGLGLATVYGIVKQNNGIIQVHSQAGKGTTFRIYLPRHAGAPSAAAVEKQAPPLQHARHTILLVEDEQAILRVTRRILEGLGYLVLIAQDPQQALELALGRQTPIDLLITDVVMPQMNGRDLAARLQAHWPELRCLFMSGYTADVIAFRGVVDEGVNFLQKPFSAAALSQRVHAILAKPHLHA